MKVGTKRGAVLAAAVILFAFAGPARAAEPAAVVATVGERTISAEHFRAQYATYLARTGQVDRPQLRRAFVEGLVRDLLLVEAAREAGIASDEAYRAHERVAREKLLIEAYLDAAVFDTVTVTEAELQEVFLRMNTQVVVRHLYAPTHAEAKALRARLVAGERFETLAREVFTDPRLAESGGLLGTIGFDEMDPAFEDAAFTLPVGELSEPVRTAQGYSIIRVDDRFAHPLLTESAFAQKRRAVELFARRRKMLATRSAFVRQTADALGVRFDPEAFDRLLGQITGRQLAASEEAMAAWLREPLLTFTEGGRERAWTVDDFRERAARTDVRHRAQVATADALREFARGLVVRDVLQERARAARVDETPLFAEALRTEMDGWVARTVRERIVRETTVPEEKLRAAFAEHGNDFTHPARRRVWEILVASETEAKELLSRLATAPFEELARAHTVRPGARAQGGDLGLLTPEQLGQLAEPVFAAEEGSVLGPFEMQGQYVLLKAGASEPARPMTFEEALPLLREEVKQAEVAAALSAYVEQLWTRYGVEIHTDVLADVSLRAS